MAIKKKDLEKLEEAMSKKYRKLRIALTEGLGEIEEIESKVKRAVRRALRNSIDEIIEKEIILTERRLRKTITTKVFNDHVSLIKKTAIGIVTHAIKGSIIYETRALRGDEFTIKRMNELYKDGWRICLHDKNNDKLLVIFHRPRIKKPEKKKVKRLPAK
jgi:hypothetical protein